MTPDESRGSSSEDAPDRREPIRVVHLLTTLDPAGVERSVLELASHLDPRRFRNEVWYLTGAGVMAPTFAARNIPVRKVPLLFEADLTIVPRLAYLLRHRRADILHTHHPEATAYGRLASANAGLRAVITTEHTVVHWSDPGRFINKLIRKTAERADRVVSVSRAVEYLARGAGAAPPDRSRIIHDGVSAGWRSGAARSEDAERSKDAARSEDAAPSAEAARSAGPSPPPEATPPPGPSPAARRDARARFRLPVEGPLVATLGRVAAHKGLGQMLEAMPLVLSERADVWFAIGGSGAGRAALEIQARNLKVRDRLIFTGAIQDPHLFLPGVDVFLLPSLTEGYGMAALEAMAHGIPVVATHVGGIPELLGKGEGGLMVNANAPGEMAAVILYLLNSALYSAEIGILGLRRATGPGSAERMAAEYAALYEEVLEGGGSEGSGSGSGGSASGGSKGGGLEGGAPS